MKTYGLLPAQELASIEFATESTAPYNVIIVGQDLLQLDTLCPPRRFWRDHPDAPWNQTIERDPAWWKAQHPEAWGATADDDPTAPWNEESAETDPLTYFDEEGDPIFWEIPTIIPLDKLPKPDDTATHTHEPTLVWFDDRVERQWVEIPKPPVPMPPKISAWQAKAALSMTPHPDAGTMLVAAEAALNAMPDGAEKIVVLSAWNNNANFERTSPTILSFGLALGMSSEDLDNLFRLGGGLTV